VRGGSHFADFSRWRYRAAFRRLLPALRSSWARSTFPRLHALSDTHPGNSGLSGFGAFSQVFGSTGMSLPLPSSLARAG